MVLGLFGIYLALAALFYLRLTGTAATTVAAHSRRSHWQRVRSLKNRAFRRLRPQLTLRVPKRTR